MDIEEEERGRRRGKRGGRRVRGRVELEQGKGERRMEEIEVEGG